AYGSGFVHNGSSHGSMLSHGSMHGGSVHGRFRNFRRGRQSRRHSGTHRHHWVIEGCQ
ncbi:unnamed protein product, partial [Phaeothamnion confervicola]